VMRGLKEEDLSRISIEIDRYNLQMLLAANITDSLVKVQPFFEILRAFWIEGNTMEIGSI
jgi:hypothetical protein